MEGALRRWDVLLKTRGEACERSLCGAGVSLLCLAFALFAAADELRASLSTLTRTTLAPQLTPQLATGSPAAPPSFPLSLDVHFPSLACSDLLLQLTEPTANADIDQMPLPFSDPSSTLSKLRTGPDGEPIGMAARLSFEQRVALGLQLQRLIHALGEVVLALALPAIRSQCTRDYSLPCPARWEEGDGGRCKAPFWYFGNCAHSATLSSFTPREKERWEELCSTYWPCVARGEEREGWRGGGVEGKGGEERSSRAAEVLRLVRALDGALETFEVSGFAPSEAASRQLREGMDALVMAVHESAETETDRRDGDDGSGRTRAWAAAAEEEVSSLRGEVGEIERSTHNLQSEQAGEGQVRRLRKWRAALSNAHSRLGRVGELAMSSLSDVGLQKLREYAVVQRNLTAVAEMMDELGRDPQHHSGLSHRVRELRAMVGELALGAFGERRAELEAEVERRLMAMLEVRRGSVEARELLVDLISSKAKNLIVAANYLVTGGAKEPLVARALDLVASKANERLIASSLALVKKAKEPFVSATLVLVSELPVAATLTFDRSKKVEKAHPQSLE
ncbi:MAG: hypothetical protein SGPRY_005897 [Prymnesium sp.]